MLKKSNKSEQFQNRILAWFDRERRDLPWRKKGKRDPYRVWLAEIMLQQTQVTAVIPYYLKFLERFPDIKTLAQAPLEEVLQAWAGLGYYSRGRNLHKCARVIENEYAGAFPETEAGLLTLPGIGPYTAAAIAAIAFGGKATVVDGNIERVLSRLFRVKKPLPKSKPDLKKLAASLTPDKRPGDYAEALMDLGATVCIPKNPRCEICPVEDLCQGRAAGEEKLLPYREKKPPRPTRVGYIYWLENDGKVLVRRRPLKGLLGGMPEFPTTPWDNKFPGLLDHAPANLNWQECGSEITHTFTHFHLILKVFKGNGNGGSGDWVAKEKLMELGFPSVMKKVAEKVLSED
ncbi:MAG: A/G-specific adenine glycosylase [Sphingomonadales bacterium]